MSAETLKSVVNMDDVSTKRRFMQKVQTMKGLWEISMKPRRFTRSLNQNAYYWVAIVTPFTEWLRNEWADSNITLEQAHEALKEKVLGTKELIRKDTGEVIEITRSSRTLDTHEFGEFIENAAAWLAEFTGIVVLSPDLFWEQPEKKRKAS
jgi:hypothetical protein